MSEGVSLSVPVREAAHNITARDIALLRLLDEAPRWAAEISAALGMRKWSQIASGMYHGNRLASLGLCSKQRCHHEGRNRIYFFISPTGREILARHNPRSSSSR